MIPYPGDPTLPPLTVWPTHGGVPMGRVLPDSASPTGWVWLSNPIGRTADCSPWPMVPESGGNNYCMTLIAPSAIPQSVKNALVPAMSSDALKQAVAYVESLRRGAMDTPALKAAVAYAERQLAERQRAVQMAPQSMGPMTPVALTTTVPKWAWGVAAVVVVGGALAFVLGRHPS